MLTMVMTMTMVMIMMVMARMTMMVTTMLMMVMTMTMVMMVMIIMVMAMVMIAVMLMMTMMMTTTTLLAMTTRQLRRPPATCFGQLEEAGERPAGPPAAVDAALPDLGLLHLQVRPHGHRLLQLARHPLATERRLRPHVNADQHLGLPPLPPGRHHCSQDTRRAHAAVNMPL